MKPSVLTLPFLLALAAPALPQTDQKTLDYLRRLDNYYYCLSRAGLKSFRCQATQTLSGMAPPMLAYDWQSIDWKNSRCGYDFSYLGGQVMPILAFNSNGGDPLATPAMMRRLTNLANSLLLCWGSFAISPLYDGANRRSNVTIERNPNAYFTLVSRGRGMTISIDFNDQALATRFVVQTPFLTQEMKMEFIHMPQGAVLRHIELDIRGKGKPLNVDLIVQYQTVQGFLLPSSMTLFERTPGQLFQATYQMSDYQIQTAGDTGPLQDRGDTVVIPAASEKAGSRHFLWRARSSTATVYLLGSIHVRPNAPLRLPEVIQRSFEESQYVGFEFDLSKMDGLKPEQDAYYEAHCTYPEGDNLMRHLTPQELARVRFLLKLLKIPFEKAIHYKPYILTQITGLMPPGTKYLPKKMGIDEIFYRKAQAAKKPVFGMEFWYEPWRLLDTLTDEEQYHFLFGDSTHEHNHVRFLSEILADWQCGNTLDIDSLINTDVSPEDKPAMDKIVKTRNIEWLAQLDRIFATRATYFIVVGSGHLVGPYGLPNLLMQKGYSVEQL